MNEQGASSILRDYKQTLASPFTCSILQDCNISHDNILKIEVKIALTKLTTCFPSRGFFWVIPTIRAVKKGTTGSLTNIDLKCDGGTILLSLLTMRILYVSQAVEVGLVFRCSNLITHLSN